jgi:hypothetical protein
VGRGLGRSWGRVRDSWVLSSDASGPKVISDGLEVFVSRFSYLLGEGLLGDLLVEGVTDA